MLSDPPPGSAATYSRQNLLVVQLAQTQLLQRLRQACAIAPLTEQPWHRPPTVASRIREPRTDLETWLGGPASLMEYHPAGTSSDKCSSSMTAISSERAALA